MLQHYKKILSVLLMTTSVVTFINLLIMYLIPVNVPLSSFTAVRIVGIAFIENRYYLIPISLLICVLLFLTTISVRRQHILLPVLTLMYLMYDFAMVLSLLIDGLHDGYWRMYIFQTVVAVTLIVLLCIYCWTYFRKKVQAYVVKPTNYQQVSPLERSAVKK